MWFFLLGENPLLRCFPTKSSSITNTAPAWSRVPFHLLQPSPLANMQVRSYATNTKDDDSEEMSTSGRQPAPDDMPSRVASSFGFQSLSSLFQQPVHGRYSAPRKRDESEESKDNASTVDAQPAAEQMISPSPPNDEGLFRAPETESTAHFSAASESDLQHDTVDVGSTAMPEHPAAPGQSEAPKPRSSFLVRKDSALPRRARSRQQTSSRPVPPIIGQAGRRPNPFNVRQSQVSRHSKDHTQIPRNPPAEQPWGLSQADQRSIQSILDPSGVAAMPSSGKASKHLRSSSLNADQAMANADPAMLTHVNSSGEAHMVDVAAKQHTRRVAIARCSVRFSKNEPARLILDNANKKGDVLGVARVAGIMAAKRTPDLIPLCHPISITKAEIDLRLSMPGEHKAWPHGAVVIDAQVECTGQTGVEMEALTAASVAALTVFDMCKAVDKAMRVGSAFVGYKSGGRSGLHVAEGWAVGQGRDWFMERGLEVPDCIEQESSPEGTVDEESREAGKIRRVMR